MDSKAIIQSNCGSHISNSISGVSVMIKTFERNETQNADDIVSRKLNISVLELLVATKSSVLEVGKAITTKDNIILSFVKALDNMAQNDSTYFSEELLTLVDDVKKEYICDFTPLTKDS